MNIKWHGQACLSLKSRGAKILLAPEQAELQPAHLEADLVLTADMNAVRPAALPPAAKFFNWPGEYEAARVSVQIIPWDGTAIIVFEADDIVFCSLGKIKTKPDQEILEKIGNVDVLFVPIGGRGLIFDYKEALDVIESVEPRVVIPINFQSGDAGGDLDAADGFLKEIGKPDLIPQESWVLKELPEDSTEYVLLTATN